ncbi:MAG: sigma-70 family RNA polymerase sigma factor [Fimbriimonadia bacterium]|jgi:RNA polymerase sigma-70 factor (ECF subfamily)
MEIPDSVLVEQSRSGDRAAFERLYRRYATGVFGFVRRMLPRREDAEDLTVQVFAKAWNGLNALRDNEAFKTWLFRIAVRQVQDFRKSSRPTEPIPPQLQDPTPGPESQAMERARADALHGAIDALSEEHRQVISLYYGQQMSVEEIGRILRLPRGTVVSRLARARDALRRSLSSAVALGPEVTGDAV